MSLRRIAAEHFELRCKFCANQRVVSSALPHHLASQFLSSERCDWTIAHFHVHGHSVCRLVPPTARFHSLHTQRGRSKNTVFCNLWSITVESWVLLRQQSAKSRGAAAKPRKSSQGDPSGGNAGQSIPKTARRHTFHKNTERQREETVSPKLWCATRDGCASMGRQRCS